MAEHDDDARDDETFDPTYATSGPRRSTFTPPPVASQPPAAGDDAAMTGALDNRSDSVEHDDDELANALAEDLSRLASGPITIVPPVEPIADAAFPAPPVTPAPPVWSPPAAATPEPPVVSTPAESAPESPAWTPPAAPEAPAAPETPAGTSTPSDEVPPWLNAPAPMPDQLVEGPLKPMRRSLPDDELLASLTSESEEPGGTLNVIEHLESQLKLREQEAREFRLWEETMLATGTPEAIAEVEQARPDFTGVLPTLPSPGAMPEQPLAAEPVAPEQPTQFAAESAAAFDPFAPLPEPPAATGQWSAMSAPVPEAAEEPAPEPYLPPTWQPFPEPAASAPPADEAAVAEPPRFDPFAEPTPTFAPIPEPGLEPFAPSQAEPTDADSGAPSASESFAWSLDTAEPEREPEPSAAQDMLGAPTAPEASAPQSLPEPWPIPAATREPVDSEPAPEAPFVPEPVAEAPFVPEPVAEAPFVPEPVAEAPFVPEPVAEAPFVPEPVAETPLAPEPVAPPVSWDPFVSMEAPAEPAPPAVSPFAPPALVEPPPFGAPVSAFAPPEIPGDVPPIDADLAGIESAPELHAQQEAVPSAPPAAEPVVRPLPTVLPVFSFDELITGEANEEPARTDEADAAGAGFAETTVIPPIPVLDADATPVTTGSISIIDQAYEEELPDDVDETDRAFGIDELATAGAVGAVAAGAMPEPVHVPSEPISTIRVASDEVVLVDNEPRNPSAFSLELGGVEPTPLEERAGRALRTFWLWFAANSSILSIALGAVVFSLGMNLRQSIVAVLAGVALSFLPLGLSTLAGKRSGLPTMVVSRAAFGLVGNAVPAVIALITRLFWGAALLWLVAFSVSGILVGGKISGGLDATQVALIALGAGFLLAFAVAFVGYHLIVRVQAVLSVLSGVLVVGFVVLTANRIDLAAAIATPDGSWLLAVTGAVLVFSFVGLVWANSGADLARYQRKDSSGAGTMLSASFGAALPAFALIAYGALLAASDPTLASGLTEDPIRAIAGLLPLWYPVPLIAGVALSLVSGAIISLYSGAFALQSVGVNVSRQRATAIAGLVLLALGFGLTLGIAGGIEHLVRDIATTFAVPTAAWAGIFAADLMSRRRRFETDSLLTPGGVYPTVNWVNLAALVVITVIGLGFTSATVGWLAWEGYAFTLLGVPLTSELATSDVGVLVALALGLIVPLALGIPTVRKQESQRV